MVPARSWNCMTRPCAAFVSRCRRICSCTHGSLASKQRYAAPGLDAALDHRGYPAVEWLLSGTAIVHSGPCQRLTADGRRQRGAITFPPQSPRDDPSRPDTIGAFEPSGSLSKQGNARVLETSREIRKSPELSRGSQVQILSARRKPERPWGPGMSSDAAHHL